MSRIANRNPITFVDRVQLSLPVSTHSEKKVGDNVLIRQLAAVANVKKALLRVLTEPGPKKSTRFVTETTIHVSR